VTPRSPRHDFRPFALLFAFKYFLDCLKNQIIGMFHCSVLLWVVYRCEENFRPDLVAEILKHATIKIPGVVDYDLLWNSVMADDVLPEILLYDLQRLRW
jgi:hypothetical protein